MSESETAPVPGSAHQLDKPRVSLWLTVAISLLALSWQLGVRGLNEPDEGRYASVAYEMLRSGDWVMPHFQGEPHLTKPPLSYWLIALSLKTFGVNEWAARLVPALAAFGTIVLTWLLAFRWLGARYALYAALLLLTAPLFFAIARLCDPNMLLTFWITLGGWAWLRWQEEGKSYQRGLYYLAHGLAFMTKGPVGCIIILLGQLAFRKFGGATLPRRRTWWWPGFLTALGLGMFWYILMIVQQPDRLDYFLRYELLDRVFTNAHKRGEPFWFFWAILPAAFLPWLPILAGTRQRGWTALRKSVPEAPLLFHILFILIFFSISRSKLPTYILPALPPLALLTAAQLRFDEAQERHFRWAKRVIAGLAVLMPAFFIFKLHASPWLHGFTVAGAFATALLLWQMKKGPQRLWVLPATGLILTTYSLLLDFVARHERELLGESTSQLMKDWRRTATERPGPFYYIHAPAGFEFYLHGPEAPQRLPLVRTQERMTSEEYVAQLTQHLERLRGQGAYVMASSRHLERVPGSVDRLPARVVAQDHKFTILETP